MTYEERKFDIGNLNGISAKTIEEHLKLYSGYVKNTNAILESISKQDFELGVSEAQLRESWLRF